MSDLGKRLKAYREKLGYTLKGVSKKTGITDSRLCKIENDHLSCPAPELKKLCELYDAPTVPLFIEAGYLDQNDLIDYQLTFSGASELDEDEKEHIQWEINKFNSDRKKGPTE